MNNITKEVYNRVTYEVYYGPKNIKQREVRTFIGDNTEDIEKAEQDAIKFFKEKEKLMHVSVFKTEEERKTQRQLLI
jgi:hypothetical protein